MTTKTGEYIGEALLENPDYPLKVLEFRFNNFGELGLQRICEGVTECKSIHDLAVGVVTNQGLKIMAEHLRDNKSLKNLFINPPPYDSEWKKDGMDAFAEMVKNSDLEYVGFIGENWQENYDEFSGQIDFFCARNKNKHFRI